MIKVRSPVGSFVVEVLKGDGSTVSVGEKILRLDSEDEDQEIERVTKMKLLSEESVKQLTGLATDRKREVLKLSVEVADAYHEYLKFAIVVAHDRAKVGEVTEVDVKQIQAEEVEARAKAAKARLMQELFEENVTHNLIVSRLSIAHCDSEISFARKKLAETVILSPASGTLSLRVGLGSFVKQGGVLAAITA